MIEDDETVGLLPTAEQEDRCWALIEAAWAPLGDEVNQARRALTVRAPNPERDREPEVEIVEGAFEAVLGNLALACADLSPAELTDLDRVVERRLYDLDREEVHEVTDGSDDGFLYARGFIVVMGRDFCDAVDRDPRMAVLDGDCEEMCYFFAHLHEERFGDLPETGSGISRESGWNRHGWSR